jgi:hypothetical protein
MSYTVTIARAASNGGDVSVSWTPSADGNGQYWVDVSSQNIQANQVTGVSCAKGAGETKDYTLATSNSYTIDSGILQRIHMEEGGGGG